PALLCTPSLHDALPISCSGRRRHLRAWKTGHGPIGPAPGRAVLWQGPVDVAGALLVRSRRLLESPARRFVGDGAATEISPVSAQDRKSTRLNSSHDQIS